MRWLIAAVLLLLLANAAWWLLRGEDRLRLERSPTPVVSVDPGPEAARPHGQAHKAVTATAPLPALRAPVAPVAPEVAAAPPPAGLLVPVRGVHPGDLHDTFDDARGGARAHEALDIMAPAGTPVLAVADGHVEKLVDSERGGLTVYQFEPSGRWCYYYAHLQAYAPGLAEGTVVRRGQVIGYVGSSGNADPAAPHLHFAVFALGPERQWWRGAPLNPYPMLGGMPAQ